MDQKNPTGEPKGLLLIQVKLAETVDILRHQKHISAYEDWLFHPSCS